jgi:hypothetical protein
VGEFICRDCGIKVYVMAPDAPDRVVKELLDRMSAEE